MSVGQPPTPLQQKLVARLEASGGSLPFAEVMETCLYDPEHGYYADPGVTTGRQGDFATAPDTGPLFGATVASAVERFAFEGPGQLVEVGPGAGRFMADLLDALAPEAAEALEVVLVEPFEVHHPNLLEAVGGHGVPVDIVDDLSEVDPGRTFVLMNELFDALPGHPVRATADGWERMDVTIDTGEPGQRLTGTWQACPEEVARFCDVHAGGLPEGHRYEASPASAGILDELSRIVDPGVVLAFDYGGRFQDIWMERDDGTLRGFREHRIVDPLSQPGETDITYDVDFTMLQAEAKDRGLRPVTYGGQERLLVHLGLVEVASSMDQLAGIKDLIVPTGFGGRFQALVLSRGGGAADAGVKVDLADPQIWMRGARGLLDEEGLGFFR